nr:hypothetical protein [Nodosilinea nodulosa]
MAQHLILLPPQLINLLQLVLTPLCFALAWALVGMTLWHMVTAVRDGVNRAKVMHKIPCSDCRYFTNNHRLKCPIHPTVALSESAIGCADFDHAGLM